MYNLAQIILAYVNHCAMFAEIVWASQTFIWLTTGQKSTRFLYVKLTTKLSEKLYKNSLQLNRDITDASFWSERCPELSSYRSSKRYGDDSTS